MNSLKTTIPETEIKKIRIVKHPYLLALLILFVQAKLLRFLFYFLGQNSLLSDADHINMLSSLNVAYWLIFILVVFGTFLPIHQFYWAKYLKLIGLQFVAMATLTASLHFGSKILPLTPYWGIPVTMQILGWAFLLGVVGIIFCIKRENDQFLKEPEGGQDDFLKDFCQR